MVEKLNVDFFTDFFYLKHPKIASNNRIRERVKKTKVSFIPHLTNYWHRHVSLASLGPTELKR